jgi:hypothetical protein
MNSEIIEELNAGRTETPEASPKQSPKRKGKIINVPTNKPERLKSYGLEDQARSSKKRRHSSTKQYGYKPHSSSYFSTPTTPHAAVSSKPKEVSPASFYASNDVALNASSSYSRSTGKYGPRQSAADKSCTFTNNFIHSFKQKESHKQANIKEQTKAFRKTKSEAASREHSFPEVINLDDEIEEFSDEVYEKVEESVSAPATTLKKYGMTSKKVSKMKASSNGSEPTRGLSKLLFLTVKKCRIDYLEGKENCYNDLALKVLKNITLYNDYGDLISNPISSLKSAQVYFVYLWIGFC